MVSKGEYIAFVDGDDMLETNFVSELYRTISKKRIVILLHVDIKRLN